MSGVFSKIFNDAVGSKTCTDFLHPGMSCRQNLNGIFYDAVIGTIKFYSPVVLIPLILKIRKWKETKTWKDFLRDTERCLLFGFLMNSFSFGLMCGFFKLFNRFYLPSLVCGPIAVGALFSFILPRHILKVEGQGMFDMYIEFLIRRAKTKWIVSLRDSKAFGTLIFSILHSSVMLGFLKNCSTNFWFSSFRPRGDPNGDNCAHVHGKLSCNEYLKQELTTTMKFACGFAGIKILPRVIAAFKTPLKIPKILLTNFDYGIVMFILSLNGIFKFVFCLLNRKTKQPVEQNCIVSALLSGVGFVFYPRFIVITLAITNAVESIYRLIARKFKEKPSLMKFIDRVPLTYLMFVWATAVDMQLRILYPHLVNKYTHRLFTEVTNGRGDRVATNLIHALMGFD